MHIGFDISQTGSKKAGCGFFAHAMIKAMLEIAPEHRYSLFPHFGDFYFDSLMPIRNPYHGQNVHYGPRYLSKESARSFWKGENAEIALGMPDIIHANNFWCPVQLKKSRLIYTLYDMGFLIDPTWTTETNRVGCFEGVFKSAIAADWVVAISEASRNHYLNVFPQFPEERIKVISPCSRFTDPKANDERPKSIDQIKTGQFWLNVGTVEPRKNQYRLIEAYSRYLRLGGVPWPLVLAGGNGWLMDDFKTQIKNLGVADHIVLTGYVSDKELIWLYRNCYANIYPSLFEGFGLPVLEGMQFGAPTIASNATSIPEVAGSAAILFPPKNIEQLAQEMLKLARDPEKRLKMCDDSLRQSVRFDWKKSAAMLIELYAEAKSRPKRKH